MPLLASALLGAASVFGFAPFALPGISLLTLAALFTLWQSAATPRDAGWLGFAFGLGLFGAGVSWVYVALNSFGDMPLPLAAIGTAGFCAYLAFYPALAGWLTTRWTAEASWPRALAAAGAWTIAEWLRSWVLSGFSWLSLGYAQLPRSILAPFAGYAPVGGVFLVSLAVVGCAAALAIAIDAFAAAARGRAFALLGVIVAIAGGGAALSRVEWTQPLGSPLAVSLVQGNVAQDLKFDPEFLNNTYQAYMELVDASRGRLIVLPESAFPVFADELPASLLLELVRVASERDGDVLTGLFTIEPPLPGSTEPRYYNSVVSLGLDASGLYRKRHLVPFGETIPIEPIFGWLINSVLSIPLSSQTAGAADQPPFGVAGQKVAIDICYEDAFGADIRSQASDATLLVNVTNDAWYGRSLAAEQHNQISGMRALETGRPLLRATNTGITSAIDHRGREIARLPWFTRGILEIEVTGRKGDTPYVLLGDWPAVAAAFATLLVALTFARRQRRRSATIA